MANHILNLDIIGIQESESRVRLSQQLSIESIMVQISGLTVRRSVRVTVRLCVRD